jgi:hypothetical protein
MRPSAIATLATGSAISDLTLFLFTLELWNASPPPVYLLCDSAIASKKFNYKGTIHIQKGLDSYSGLTRAQMERTSGKTQNQWTYFMLEKTTLLEWALSEQPNVLFCDCDICFMGPIFEIPEGATLAVSQHMIRPQDEARFGTYNGGMIWVSQQAQIDLWRTATKTSRFFEQAAIEDVAAATPKASLYQIPRQENYGWWRLWQGIKPANELFAEWSIRSRYNNSGIMIGNQPLGSIHTHFGEVRDAATTEYNKWVLNWLSKLTMHPPAQQLLGFIHGLHPWMLLD